MSCTNRITFVWYREHINVHYSTLHVNLWKKCPIYSCIAWIYLSFCHVRPAFPPLWGLCVLLSLVHMHSFQSVCKFYGFSDSKKHNMLDRGKNTSIMQSLIKCFQYDLSATIHSSTMNTINIFCTVGYKISGSLSIKSWEHLPYCLAKGNTHST